MNIFDRCLPAHIIIRCVNNQNQEAFLFLARNRPPDIAQTPSSSRSSAPNGLSETPTVIMISNPLHCSLIVTSAYFPSNMVSDAQIALKSPYKSKLTLCANRSLITVSISTGIYNCDSRGCPIAIFNLNRSVNPSPVYHHSLSIIFYFFFYSCADRPEHQQNPLL